MIYKFFESFEDIYRSSVESDDSYEVHISDSEEELPRLHKKSVSNKKIGNTDILPKTSPCDYNLAVKEWSFCKTETAKLLQPSSKLTKLNSREKRQSVGSRLDTTKNSEDSSKKENLFKESRVSVNLSSTPENELSVHEPFERKSMLLEIQNANSLPQSGNVYAKPIKKSSKFCTDDDLLSGVQMTPRVRKIKPQLLKGISSDVLINSHASFKIYQEKCPGVSKNAGVSVSFTHMQSLKTPKIKKMTLPQTSDAKRNISDITSESFVECEDVHSKISKDTSTFVDCSFLEDAGVATKIKKVKVEDILDEEKKNICDFSLNFETSQGECPEISESSGSVVKGSASQSIVNEDYISDCSDNLVLHNVCQGKTSLVRNCSEEKCCSLENFENINGCAEGNEDILKMRCSLNAVSSMPKGSDFVKSIKFYQESVPKPKKELEVHSERKKKYLSGGFAEQAQKLDHREKSSVVLWSYQKTNEAGMGTGRYLSLKINLFSIVDSFVIAKCEILKDSNISVEQNKRESLFSYVFRRNGTEDQVKTEPFPKQGSSKELANDFKDCVYSHIVRRRREKFKDCVVAIKLETWKQLKLSTDAIIRIYPPWQTLWISSLNVQVLLCTYFMEVLSIPLSVEKLPSEKVLYSRDAPYNAIT